MPANRYAADWAVQAERLSPPSKRQPRQLAWLRALLKPLQQLSDFISLDYRTGGTDLVSGDAIIGIEERLTYNGQAMVLEAVLNKVFGVGNSPYIIIVDQVQDILPLYFRNPNEGYPPVFSWQVGSSPAWDILTAYTAGDTVMFDNKRWIALQNHTGEEPANNSLFWDLVTLFVKNEGEYIPANDFTIQVPASTWAGLGLNDTQREARVRAEADKYVIAGVKYNVISY